MNKALQPKTPLKALSLLTLAQNRHKTSPKALLVKDFGTENNLLSDDELKSVQDELNNRPRKSLGWRTPKEVFFEHLKCCT